MPPLYQPYQQYQYQQYGWPQNTASSITTSNVPYYVTSVRIDDTPTVALTPPTPWEEGPLDWLDRRVKEVCTW